MNEPTHKGGGKCNFLAKLFSKTVNCFSKMAHSCCFSFGGKSRFLSKKVL